PPIRYPYKSGCCTGKSYNAATDCCDNNQIVPCCPSGIWVGTIFYGNAGFVANGGPMYGSLHCVRNSRAASITGIVGGHGLWAGIGTGTLRVKINGAKYVKNLVGKN